jgi:hypothetical protein
MLSSRAPSRRFWPASAARALQGIRERADWEDMWAGETFGDILDAKLGVRLSAAQDQPDEVSPYHRPVMPPTVQGAAPHPGLHDVAPSQACGAYAQDARAAQASAAAARSPRPLTSAQRTALQVLQDAGAALLDAAFTDADLRTAFRSLARQFHPDCHPGATEAERRSLAQAFARVTDAYRVLAVLMAN